MIEDTGFQITQGHEVGTIVAKAGRGIATQWIVVCTVIPAAGRVTHRHAEAFDAARSEVADFMREMIAEAKLCADALEDELMAARIAGRNDVREIIQAIKP